MAKYRIKITLIDESAQDKYPREETVYEQIFTSNLDKPLEEIIKAVNK